MSIGCPRPTPNRYRALPPRNNCCLEMLASNFANTARAARTAMGVIGNLRRFVCKARGVSAPAECAALRVHARCRVTQIALSILLLFNPAYSQVQSNGAVSLTGSVQLMAGGKHSIALTWSATQDQDISFRVYRSTTSGSNYKLVQSLVPCLHYTDLNVSNSTTYYYVITSYDSATNAESAYSNQVTATTPN
jgi:hypothetical protein